LVAVQDGATEVRQGHFKERLLLIVRLLHVQREELVGDGLKRLLVDPRRLRCDTLAPLLNLPQGLVDLESGFVCCQAGGCARKTGVWFLVKMQFEVPCTLPETFLGVKEVDHSACDWDELAFIIVDRSPVHVKDLD